MEEFASFLPYYPQHIWLFGICILSRKFCQNFLFFIFESKWKRTGEGGIEIQHQWKHTTEQHTSLMQNTAPARNVNIMKSIKKVTTVCPGTPTSVALFIILFSLYKIQHLRILMFWQFGDKTRITLQCTDILQYG